MLYNLRISLRALAKAPGFTAGAVLTLALAVGANSAMFSAVYAVLLQPMAIRQPEDLVIVWARDDPRNLPLVELSYRNFQDWTARSRSFSSVTAVGSSTWPATLTRDSGSIRASSAGVSASFFDTLGVAPERGRGFRAADEEKGARRVVVLSHGFWTSRFGADPSLIGATIQLDVPHTVVGVMPEAFDFPRGTDYWTPVVPILADRPEGWRTDNLEKVGVLFVIARLRDGMTPPIAADELNRVADQLERDGGAERFGSAVVVTPLLEFVLGPTGPALWALFAAVGVLLLIGCANVSGLMLARVSLKSRDQAIRLALGATRRHLGEHWAREILILSAAGGLLGLVSSRWIVQGLVALAPPDVPRLSNIAINLPVAAFTFAAVLLTALLCGFGPIRRAGRSQGAHALSDLARPTPGRHPARVRSLLAVFQIALTVVLLVAAGLVMRSFINLRQIDLGFQPSNVLTMHVSPSDPKPSANEWIETLLERISALPGTEASGGVYLRPLALGAIGQETGVILDGQPLAEESARNNPALNYQVATPGYFPAMRIPLKQGRFFNATDRASSERVVIVGASTAKRLWPGQDPIGRRLLVATQASDGSAAWRTVIGVVSDVRYRGLDDVRLDIYDPASQSPFAASDLMIRTSGNPLGLVAPVQAEARSLDPHVLVDNVTTMEAIVSGAIAPWRFSVWLFTLFAALAFVLAAVGLFSLVSLDVANRRYELAVRLALGAAQGQVTRSVFFAAARPIVAGVVAGVLAALASTRAMRSLLFAVDSADAMTYAAVIALVLAVVGLAAYVPIRRAASIDPLALLRRT